MAESNLPATEAKPDPRGFLSDPVTTTLLTGLKAQADKYSIPILAKEFKAALSQLVDGPEVSVAPSRTAAIKEKPATTKQYAIIDELYKDYDIIFVESTHTLYYRDKESDESWGWDNSKIFRIFPDFVQRRALANAARNLPTPIRIDAREANDTAKTLIEETGRDETKRRQEVDNVVIQITNNLFWDGHIGKLTDHPQHDAYRRLFDTTTGGGDAIKWTEQQETDWNLETNEIVIKGYYERALSILEEYGGIYPQDENHKHEKGGAPWMNLPYIEAWADGNYDTFMDILRAIASCFLKTKIRGAYFLIGAGANGKSAFNDLLRTLFGKNNCARLSLENLNNAHKNMTLSTCVVNLPDEQKDTVMEHQETFKSMTAHQDIELDVYYSQTPQPVTCNFMCFFPMNHLPDWGDSGAKACIDRCWPIFFTRDFSKLGTQVENFQESTYTPENMKILVPVVLALAAYHSKHPLERSPTMEANRGMVEMETSSATTYRNKMFSLFNAFKNIKWLYQDYMAWCDDNGIPYQKLKEFKTFILTNTREEWVYIPAINKTEKCLVTAAWRKDDSYVLHPDNIMDSRNLRMRDLYTIDREKSSMRSAVTIKEALVGVQKVTSGNPDRLPQEKPKSSAKWVEEHEKGEGEQE